MAMQQKLGVLLGGAALALAAACSQDLNVTNPDNPDIPRALATPNDVKSLAISSVNSWYLTSNDVDPYMMLGVTADAYTGNFGNFGMRFNNLQPRIPYNNASAASDAEVAREPWDNNYANLNDANDVLRAFARGIVLDNGPAETDQYKSLAMFVQAATLTNIALLFDKAFVVDETFDPTGKVLPQLVPYTEVAAAAQKKWDAVIAATAGKTYEYGDAVLPMGVQKFNGVTLNRIANTMAALLLTYTPRTAAEVPSVDWAKVLQYADKGIGTGSAGAPFDFTVKGDNTNWYSYNAYYGDETTWVRTDLKLIHKMDPTVPAEYTGASTNVPPSGNGDKRLTTDYTYTGAVIGDPSRGIYMQSPYFHSRYKFYARTSTPHATGAVPYILAAESDLAKAEALVQTNGDLALAAQLINNTRVTRGGLPPVSATDSKQTLLDAITYEREVETLSTDGFTFFQLRHVDDLRDGTVRHLPIPAKELETLQLPIYTFGGVGQPVKSVAGTGMFLPSLAIFGQHELSEIELPSGGRMAIRMPARQPRLANRSIQ
ncbi:MAG TPA: RagB/SusD family nutrient uptake outer membrane protein [Gemmatimonadaceae bacterium]|nr:RagB/SusD family nutrient uptake outer membrane protein [Gemmatimonadaceae bacterium]